MNMKKRGTGPVDFQRCDHWFLKEKIREGSFGTVYRTEILSPLKVEGARQ